MLRTFIVLNSNPASYTLKPMHKDIKKIRIPKIGFLVFLASIFSSTFAIFLSGNVRISDLLLLLSFVFASLQSDFISKNKQFPRQFFVVPTMILIIEFLRVFVAQLSGVDQIRYRNISTYDSAHWLLLSSWFIDLLLVPYILFLYTGLSFSRIKIVIRFLVLGIAFSSLIAILTKFGFFTVNGNLIRQAESSTRFAGLADHPNSLGISCVFVAPAVAFLFRNILISLSLQIILLSGVWLSGSRTALYGYVLSTLFASLIKMKGKDVKISKLRKILSFTIFGLFLFIGTSILGLSKTSRIGSSSAIESDYARTQFIQEAIIEIQSSPFIGNGISVLKSYNNLALQIASSEGLLLLTFIFYKLFHLLKFSIKENDSNLYRVLGAMQISWMIMGLTTNAITEFYLYIPLSLLLLGWFISIKNAAT